MANNSSSAQNASPAPARPPGSPSPSAPLPPKTSTSVDPVNFKAPQPAPWLIPLAGAGLALSVLALLIGVITYLQLRRSHRESLKLINDLKIKISSLGVGVETLRNRAEASRPLAPTRSTESFSRAKPAPSPAAKPQGEARQAIQPSHMIGIQQLANNPPPLKIEESIQTNPEPTPAPLSKASLIQSLNQGDRLALREHAKLQLNITTDSENALAMGRSQSTQLEAVSGGGSYWLAIIEDQAWLFPTELTLKGFSNSQPNKGVYTYEKQMISKPQLISPALLRNEGNLWSVENPGQIAIP